MALSKPIFFLHHCKGFHIVISLDDIFVLVHSNLVDNRAHHFCVLYWFALDDINFSKSDICLTQTVEIVLCHSECMLACSLLSTFPFQLSLNWNSYVICNRPWLPCNFHFVMWLYLQVHHPLTGPFIFWVLVSHYQLVDPGLGLCEGPCSSFR